MIDTLRMMRDIREEPSILLPGKRTWDFIKEDKSKYHPAMNYIGAVVCPVSDVILGAMYYGVGVGFGALIGETSVTLEKLIR